jgi:hypothetical protein
MYKIVTWDRATQSDKEFFNLAPTPNDEECTPVGQDEQSQIKECTALINQLIRKAGKPDEGAEFFIVENHHEIGTYYEAGIFYIPSPEMSEEESESEIYAMVIEQNIPDKWDAEALQELRNAGHPKYQAAKVVRMKAA